MAIELGGLQAGTEYDQLQIFGDAALAGTLDVTLINGFTLAEDQEFLIADIAGALSGQFKGLDEGYQVGSFDNQALYITYNAGNGNSIALFTSVPEPANFLPLCICLFWRMNRRRRAQNPVPPTPSTTVYSMESIRCIQENLRRSYSFS